MEFIAQPERFRGFRIEIYIIPDVFYSFKYV